MANKKSAAELRGENRILRRTNTAMAVASVINSAIRWGVVGFLGYCGYLSINVLAGKITSANILVSFLGNLTVSKWVAYIVGGGCLIYGIRERKLRRSTVKRLQARNQKFEAALDPKRTSSFLTERGETHPRDKE